MKKILLIMISFFVFSSKPAEFKDFSEENKKDVLGYFRALIKCTYGSQEQCKKSQDINNKLSKESKDIQNYTQDLGEIAGNATIKYRYLEEHECEENFFVEKFMQFIRSKQKAPDYNKAIDRISDRWLIALLETNEALKKQEWAKVTPFSFGSIWAYGDGEADKIPLRYNIINGTLDEWIAFRRMRQVRGYGFRQEP